MRLFIDPPKGWLYGFPKIWDEEKDGHFEEWLVSQGYPAQMIKNYGEAFFVRQWVAEDEDTSDS